MSIKVGDFVKSPHFCRNVMVFDIDDNGIATMTLGVGDIPPILILQHISKLELATELTGVANEH